MQNPTEETDELVRRRQRNRVAQQKYRRRLKSHIENLEKRAAVADRLCKKGLPEDLTSSFGPFPNDQMAGAESSITAALNIGQNGSKPSNTSSGSGDSPISQHSRPNTNRRDSSLIDDVEFLRAFPLSSEDLSGHKSSGFHDMGMLDIQEDTVEALESLRFTASGELEEVPNPSNSSTSRSSLFGSIPKPTLDITPGLDLGSLESRVDYVLRSIQSMGFETPDSFMSSYYTDSFKDKSAAKIAQDASRRTGLPQMLNDLRPKTEDWPIWESRSYTDSVVRSAAYLIAGEFDSLGKKRYACEQDLQKGLVATVNQVQSGSSSAEGPGSLAQLYSAAAELKKTLRNELPNLHALIATLSSDDSAAAQATRVQLLLATIKIIAASADEPLQEAANWMYHRANPP